MEFIQLKKRILNRLRNELDSRCHYHTAEHTVMVLKSVDEIADYESVDDRERDLLKLAALFHDTGYLISRDEHEKHSCELMLTELDLSEFTEDEVDLIRGMIMATRIPQSPANKLEEIMADADLHYLGTDEYEKYAGLFYEELKSFDSSLTDARWLDVQISFLESHTFFTAFGKTLEKKKLQNLAALRRRRDR